MGRGKALISKVSKPTGTTPRPSELQSNKKKVEVKVSPPQEETRNLQTPQNFVPTIENDFKCLDAVINGFTSRRQLPFIARYDLNCLVMPELSFLLSVQEAMCRMTNREFTLVSCPMSRVRFPLF